MELIKHQRVIHILYSREVTNANGRVSHLVHSVIDVLSMVLVLGIFLTLMQSSSVQSTTIINVTVSRKSTR